MQNINFKDKQYQEHFYPILSEWIKIINDYTNNIDPKDGLYRYLERTTVSSLAGAAWRCGYYAPEETSVHKSPEKVGRLDLRIVCNRLDTLYVIEAKQIERMISPFTSQGFNDLTLFLLEARRDAKSVIEAAGPEYKGKGLGVLFVKPIIPLSQSYQAERLINEFIRYLEHIEYDILCYTFPVQAKAGSVIDDEGKNFFPGIVLLAHAP